MPDFQPDLCRTWGQVRRETLHWRPGVTLRGWLR